MREGQENPIRPVRSTGESPLNTTGAGSRNFTQESGQILQEMQETLGTVKEARLKGSKRTEEAMGITTEIMQIAGRITEDVAKKLKDTSKKGK